MVRPLAFVVVLGSWLADRSGARRRPPLWFALLLALVAMWNLYINLHRISRVVTFDGQTLRWSAVIGDGAIQVDELTAIRSGPLGSAPIRFQCATTRSVLVLGGPGLPEADQADRPVSSRHADPPLGSSTSELVTLQAASAAQLIPRSGTADDMGPAREPFW